MKKRIVTVLAVALLAIALACGAVFASGTAEDPLISLSYLNSVVIPQLTTLIEQKVQEAAGAGQITSVDEQKLQELVAKEVADALSGGSSEGGAASASQYEAVQLFAGQTMVGSQGSIEVLLRRGTFHCVDPEGQKITNVTKGSEAGDGNELTLQNLYLIPRSDGRGITCASEEGWGMVRGAYTIQ